MKMCRDPEDAQDVLQETLFAAARTLHGFRGASSVSTWLYTIARSFCIKKRRRSEVRSGGRLARHRGAARRERPATAHPIPSGGSRSGRWRRPWSRDRRAGADVPRGAAAARRRGPFGGRGGRGHGHQRRGGQEPPAPGAPVRAGPPRAAAGPGRPSPMRRPGVCPDVVDLFSRHLEGEIDPETCAEMERHLAACPRCQAACDSLGETFRLCGADPCPRCLRTSRSPSGKECAPSSRRSAP